MIRPLALALLFAWPAFAAPPTFEERLEEARESAADKEWAEAIPIYEALVRQSANSPKGETLTMELANAYFASGALNKAIATADRFIATHKNSSFVLQMRHLKAFSLWSQGLFDDSLAVFAGQTWEELRAMPQKMRPRVYDVIARDLASEENDIGARVVRAEAAGKLKNEKGQPILKGRIADTLEKVDTEEAWAALTKHVSAAAKSQIAVSENKAPVKDKKLRWGYFVVGFSGEYSSVMTSTTNYSQFFLKPQIELDFLLSHTGSQLAIYTAYSLLPLSKGPAGETLRWMETGFLFDARVVGGGEPGLSFSVNLGMFYRFSQVDPGSQPRLDNCIGLDVFPSFRYQFPNGSSLGWYGKVSPFLQSMKVLDLGNVVTGGGMDYQFEIVGDRLWLKVFAEGEKVRFKFSDGSLFENIMLRFGAKALF